METLHSENPHELGVGVIKHLDKMVIGNIFQVKESINVWLEEVLEQCKKSFARVQPEFLPKTPSAKRSKRKYNIISPSNGERPSKRLSLAKKTRGGRKKKGGDSTDTEVEADDESDKTETSLHRTTRPTRAASRTATVQRTTSRSNRPTRSTRARKPDNTHDSRTVSPVMCIQMDAQRQQTPKTPNHALGDNDLRHRLVSKPSLSVLPEGISKLPASPKTPRVPLNSTLGSNSPRHIPGYMSVKQRASLYEETILSSNENTPTNIPKRKVTQILSVSSAKKSCAVGITPPTPLTGIKNRAQATPTVTRKSKANINLSSNGSGAGSASRPVIKVRKNSTVVPTTPVSSLKPQGSNNRRSSRASLRRSLIKQTASKSRRSSVLRHQKLNNQIEEKDEQEAEEIKNTPSEKPKLRSKLTLKKTKVLKPKATRSRAAKKSEDKGEISTEDMQTSADFSQSSDNLSKSSIRRGTVTLSSVDTTQEQEVFVPNEAMDCEPTVADDGENCVDISSADEKSAANDADKMVVGEGPKSDPELTDIPARKSRSMSTSSATSERKGQGMDTVASEETEALRPRRTTRKGQKEGSTPVESEKSAASEETRNSGSSDIVSKKRTSSQSSLKRERTKTPPEEKETESLRPKRTRQATKQASTSSVTSDSESSRPKRSSRAKSRASKASNSSSVTSDHDGCGDADEEMENEIFAVPDGPAPKANRSSRKRLISETSESDSKRLCVTDNEEGASDVDHSSREESSNLCSEDERTTSESDTDAVDRSPSPTCPANKVVRPNPSFLNNMSKDKNKPLFNINSGGTVKSFLRSSPVKKPPTQKEQEIARRKELEEKQRKENERIERRKQLLLKQAEKKKKQREEHLRKVQQIREQKMRREREVKEKLMEKMEHRNKIPEQVMEVKRKEKQEKKQIREQKHTEAEERRLQEEAERLRKLKEKEEEERQHAELLQRKKEFEEQERLKKIAEEKRKQEEHQRELERKRREEELRQQQLQQEAEQLKLKQQSERERDLQKQKAEKYVREMKELEAKKQHESKAEAEMKKLKELERQRIIAWNQRQEEIRQIDERYKQLMGQQKEMEVHRAKPGPLNGSVKENLNSTMTLSQPSTSVPKSPQSYQLTPTKKYVVKKHSEESYDISDLKSDASTDEEDVPRKKIPTWAQDRNLRASIVNQYYYQIDTAALFGYIKVPDLNEMFVKKKPRFNKRTSSANWDSPLLKQPVSRTQNMDQS